MIPNSELLFLPLLVVLTGTGATAWSQGLNVASSGGNAGVLRLRNALEVWPSDDATRAGRLSVRNGSGNATISLDGAIGSISCVVLNQTSDRDQKENFAPIRAGEVLEKVASLPIHRWNFKGDAAAPHVGPMAQDFHAAFGTGREDKHIATVDADGVALAAIQGLNQKLDERLRAKELEIAELQRRLERLENQMTARQSN